MKLRNSEAELKLILFRMANGKESFSYPRLHLNSSLRIGVKKAPSLSF